METNNSETMLIQLNLFLSLALSFTIVYFVIPKIVKVSKIKNLFDIPNHRSAAKRATPRLGGVAILAGFVISLIISADNLNINSMKYLFVGVMTMFMIGIKDDFIGLAAKKKFLIQILMAVYLVTLGHFNITIPGLSQGGNSPVQVWIVLLKNLCSKE